MLFRPTPTYAATCTAAASGNWNTVGTWSCGHVPTYADVCNISGGATTTVDTASAVCSSLTIGNTNGIAALVFNNGSVLSVSSTTIGGAGSRSGRVNMAAGGTFKIGTTFTLTKAAPNPWTRGTGTVEYNGTAAQTVNTTFFTSYNNLTFSNSGTKTTPAGTITVYGNWDVTNATAALNTNNTSLTITGNVTGSGGTITSGSGTISLGGNWTNSGTFNADSGTVNYSKTSGGQTVGGLTYNNLTLSNTSATNTASGAVVVNGTLTTTAGGALNLATYALSGTLGTITNNGTLETQNTSAAPLPASKTWGGTVVFDGAAAQSVATSTFNNLTVNNSNGLSITGDITVNGLLNIVTANPSASMGAIDTGAHRVIMGSLSTTLGLGEVTGNVFRAGPFSSAHDYSFGGQYTLFNFPGSSAVTNINLKLTRGTAPAWKTDAVKRQYDLTLTPGVGSSMGLMSLHYFDSELNGNAEDRLAIWKYDGSLSEVGRASHDTSINLVTFGPSDFSGLSGTSLGLATTSQEYYTWDGSADTDWYNDNNWDGNSTPTTTSNVIIPDAATTPNDPAVPASGVTIKTIEIQSGGVLNTASGYTLTLTGGSASPPSLAAWDSHGTFNSPTGTVVFTGNQASFAGTADFNNVTIAPGATLYNRLGSTMRISGTLTNGGTWYPAFALNNTVEYNGGNQTVVEPNGTVVGYKNLTIGGTGTKTLPATLTVAGDFTNNGNPDFTGNTLVLSGTTDQNLGGTGSLAFNNLTLNDAGYRVNAGKNISVAGDLVLSTSSTLDMATYDLTSLGAVSGNGTLETASVSGSPLPSGKTWTGTVSYVSVPGGQTVVSGTYNNLTVNQGGSAATLGGDVTVGGVLDLAAGVVTTGGNAVYVNSTGNTIRTTGRVNGSLKKYVATGATSKTFEIGDASYYAPVSVSFGNVSVAGDLTIKTTANDHPAIASSQISVAKSVNRYWSATNTGITFDNYSAVFNFDTADKDIGSDASRYLVGKYSVGAWSYPSVGTKNANDTQVTGLTGFSDFQIGESSIDYAALAVAADKAALSANDIKGGNADLSHVTTTLTNPLPSIGSASGSAIAWASDATSTVSDDGQTINRPIYSAGDATVHMAATFTSSTASTTTVFDLTVLKLPASTDAKVTSGVYTVSGGSGPAETVTNVPFGVSSSTFLGNLSKSESHSTWDISGIHNPVLTGDALVVTAEDGVTQITYTVTVLPDPAFAAVAADKAALSANDIRDANPDLAHVTVHLANPLPSIGSASGSAIAWASDATSTVSNDGQTINRPIYSAGDATVHMTATFTSSTASTTTVFDLTVLKLPASTDAKVTSGVYTVSGGSGPAETVTNVPFNTSKATFEGNLSKSESHSSWNDAGIHNPVVSGDTLVVTAEDGVTQITYTVTVLPDYAGAAVAADKAALVANDIKGANLNLSNVTTTLTNPLPSIGSASGSAITWLSDATGTVSNDGQTVNRPAFSVGDATVHMTATIASSTASDTKVFTLTVLKLPVSTDAKVTSGSYMVSGGSGPAETIVNVPFGTAKTTFLANLTKSESHSSWNSAGINDPVLTGDTLIVTAEDGVTTITYTVTVGSNPAIAAVAADKAALIDNDIRDANPDLAHVTVHLANPLPALGSASGSTITWASDVTGTVSNDGQTINRPIYSAGDATVHMTATIASSTVSDTKVFALTVLKLPASTDAKVTSGAYTVSGGSGPAETVTNVPYGTAKAAFEGNLSKSESHSTWNDAGIHNPVVSGDTLVVTAEDGVTQITYTITVNPDVTPPAISGIGATPSDTGASIHWTTDELASTKVIYGADLSYSLATTETDASPGVTSHTKSLVGLSACTAYHYKVVSRDAALNSATSTDQTFTTTGCETGGGGVSMAPAVGVTVNGQVVPLDFTINNGAAETQNKVLNLALNADMATVRGYAASLDPALSNTSLNAFAPSVTFELPDVSGSYTVYLRYYSTTGQPSQILSHAIKYTSPTGGTAETGHFTNPSNLQALLSELPTVCDQTLSDEVLKQVLADAKEFGLALTQDQAVAIRNFVLCGNSAATIKFGRGERRAIIRDYMETVHRSDVVWSDVERLATGLIPLARNLALERARVNTVLPVFRRIFGHDPNFKVYKENLAWNALLYRIRFARDLSKERAGLLAYRTLYSHDPLTPFSWAVVRVLGYVK